MKADKRATRAKKKAKAANVARQRGQSGGGKFYGVPIPNDFLIDLVNFLHDQNRPDCNEILNGLQATRQVIGDQNVFNQEWIKRAVEKRNQLTGA